VCWSNCANRGDKLKVLLGSLWISIGRDCDMCCLRNGVFWLRKIRKLKGLLCRNRRIKINIISLWAGDALTMIISKWRNTCSRVWIITTSSCSWSILGISRDLCRIRRDYWKIKNQLKHHIAIQFCIIAWRNGSKLQVHWFRLSNWEKQRNSS